MAEFRLHPYCGIPYSYCEKRAADLMGGARRTDAGQGLETATHGNFISSKSQDTRAEICSRVQVPHLSSCLNGPNVFQYSRLLTIR